MTKLKDLAFIWGDLHLGSESMFNRYYSKDFKTMEDYHKYLIKVNNTHVHDDNVVVLFLGDIGYLEHFKVIEQMKGYKILIKGNHDTYKDEIYNKYFKEVYDYPLFYHKRIVFSHIPIPVEEGVINVHGHTHAINLAKPNYFNICPEQIGYKPVTVRWVTKKLSLFKKPSYKFLKEWYKDIQVTTERHDLVLNNDKTINVKETEKLMATLNKYGLPKPDINLIGYKATQKNGVVITITEELLDSKIYNDNWKHKFTPAKDITKIIKE